MQLFQKDASLFQTDVQLFSTKMQQNLKIGCFLDKVSNIWQAVIGKQ
jgi:hypothetical protein